MPNPIEMQFDLFTTLTAATDWLVENAEQPQGAICPCCGRFDKIYNRKVSQTMIRDLSGLYRYTKRHGEGFYHYKLFMPGTTRCGDFGKLALIGLLEQPVNTDAAKHTSGLWKITEKGKAFVESKLSIPERMIIYHGELIETAGISRGIRGFWPEFNYTELMTTGAR